jgi:predicted NUDIX family phosphoesterase
MLGILDTKEFEELLNIYKQIQSEFYNKEKGILFLKYMEQRNLSEAYGVLKAWRL